MSFFIEYPVVFYGVAIYLGLMIGSFLNVVIHRFPIILARGWEKDCRELLDHHPHAEKDTTVYNLAIPRSSCPQCGHQISAIENIPIVSYLWLKGKCRSCGVSISAQYPLIEFITACAAFLVAISYGPGLTALFVFAFVAILLVLTMIDLSHRLLPDQLTLSLLWLGLLANTFGLFVDLNSAVVGALVGYLSLWSIFQVFKLITGKEGMGYGDFKLFAALGAWLGWQSLLLILLLSSVVGVILAVSYVLLSRKKTCPKIPFGPFLAFAGIIAMFWGNEINQAYLQWVGLA